MLVRVEADDARARLVVEDDGRGFDTGETGDGFGLEGMRERVALLDGRLAVESGEAGTTLVAEVPLR